MLARQSRHCRNSWSVQRLLASVITALAVFGQNDEIGVLPCFTVHPFCDSRKRNDGLHAYVRFETNAERTNDPPRCGEARIRWLGFPSQGKRRLSAIGNCTDCNWRSFYELPPFHSPKSLLATFTTVATA